MKVRLVMSKKINLGFALNLPNQRAIDYFTSKKVVSSDKIAELGESAHAKAFTLKNVNNLNLLQDFKSSLDEAIKSGKGFNAWRNEILDITTKRGWINDGNVVNPDTGEIMPPHRLGTIFHTNMNSAFQSSRYQRQLDNASYMPYWEYVAVNDEVTRASHAALHSTIKRYDDPFWQMFYPPIDYRCRCTVIARSNFYVEKRGIKMNTAEMQEDKHGQEYFERAGQKVYPGQDFKYNVHRHGYKPNLDKYDSKLGNQFAEQDMSSPEFKMQYERLQGEYIAERKRLGLSDSEKIDRKSLNEFRNSRRYQLNFTAGVINHDVGFDSKTVWLSDDTLLKQFDSRLKDDLFDIATYAKLPSLINKPDYILEDGDLKRVFVKQDGERWLRAVVKLTAMKELYLDSVYLVRDKNFQKELKKAVVIKKP